MHKAAMKESMAAGLLLLAGWKEACEAATPERPLALVDPMVGSGSFLIEGALIAADMAPGLMRIHCDVVGSRIPPVVRWKCVEEDTAALWKDQLLQATQRAKEGWQRLRSSSFLFTGSDIYAPSLALAEKALERARLDGMVTLTESDCADWRPDLPDEARWTVVCNPPWGVRLTEDMHAAWEALRVFLRETCPPGRTQAWILSGNPEATRHLGLRRTSSSPLQTGQQKLRWLQYTLFDEKQRQQFQNRGVSSSSEATNAERKVQLSKTKVAESRRKSQDKISDGPPNRTIRTKAKASPDPAENEWLI
jgi:23S rRNA G2445 N2-methylase RlmL